MRVGSLGERRFGEEGVFSEEEGGFGRRDVEGLRHASVWFQWF